MAVGELTALQVAAEQGNTEMVEWLLIKGAIITPRFKKIIPTLEFSIRQNLNNHLKTLALHAPRVPVIKYDDDEVEKTFSTAASSKASPTKKKKKKVGAAEDSAGVGVGGVAVAPSCEKGWAAKPVAVAPSAEPAPVNYLAADATPNAFAVFRDASEAVPDGAEYKEEEEDEIDYSIDLPAASAALSRVSAGLGDEGVVNFIFARDSRIPQRGKITFKNHSLLRADVVSLLERDEDDAAASGIYIKERPPVVPLAHRVAECSVAALRPKEVAALSEDAVDHVVSESLILNALRFGSSYLSRENVPGKLPCLLVVAPVEREAVGVSNDIASKEKNFLTLCFEVDGTGVIGRCFHFCAQNRHPGEISDGGEYKYALWPLHLRVKIRQESKKHKLQLKAASVDHFKDAYQQLLKR